MKKSVIFIMLLLVINSCSKQELSTVEENGIGINTSNELSQYVKEFLKIDSVKYEQFCKDEGFVKLCNEYKEQRDLSLRDTNLVHLQERSDEWFGKIDSFIGKYECPNLFSYILAYLNTKATSRASHAWGECYFVYKGEGINVCNTKVFWLNAWNLASEQERSANSILDYKLDVSRYRELCFEYLERNTQSSYGPSDLFYEYGLTSRLLGNYGYAKNQSIATVTQFLELCGVWPEYICLTIYELKEEFYNFFLSRIWENAVLEDREIPGGGENPGGPQNPGGSGGSENPGGFPVVDATGLEDNWYLDCIYKTLIDKSARFKGISSKFIGDNSIAHLKYVLSDKLPDNVNGRFNLNMQNYWFTIELNEIVLLNSAPLTVAKTIIHETIHADIFVKLLSLQSSPKGSSMDEVEVAALRSALTEQDFPTLYYFYEKYVYDATAQHQYMASYFVDYIA